MFILRELRARACAPPASAAAASTSSPWPASHGPVPTPIENQWITRGWRRGYKRHFPHLLSSQIREMNKIIGAVHYDKQPRICNGTGQIPPQVVSISIFCSRRCPPTYYALKDTHRCRADKKTMDTNEKKTYRSLTDKFITTWLWL